MSLGKREYSKSPRTCLNSPSISLRKAFIISSVLAVLFAFISIGSIVSAQYVLPVNNTVYINNTGVYLFNATDGVFYNVPLGFPVTNPAVGVFELTDTLVNPTANSITNLPPNTNSGGLPITVVINGTNIVFKGNEFSIVGNKSWTVGVYVTPLSSSVQVQNVSIVNGTVGLWVDSSENVVIGPNVIIENHTGVALKVEDTDASLDSVSANGLMVINATTALSLAGEAPGSLQGIHINSTYIESVGLGIFFDGVVKDVVIDNTVIENAVNATELDFDTAGDLLFNLTMVNLLINNTQRGFLIWSPDNAYNLVNVTIADTIVENTDVALYTTSVTGTPWGVANLTLTNIRFNNIGWLGMDPSLISVVDVNLRIHGANVTLRGLSFDGGWLAGLIDIREDTGTIVNTTWSNQVTYIGIFLSNGASLIFENNTLVNLTSQWSTTGMQYLLQFESSDVNSGVVFKNNYFENISNATSVIYPGVFNLRFEASNTMENISVRAVNFQGIPGTEVGKLQTLVIGPSSLTVNGKPVMGIIGVRGPYTLSSTEAWTVLIVNSTDVTLQQVNVSDTLLIANSSNIVIDNTVVNPGIPNPTIIIDGNKGTVSGLQASNLVARSPVTTNIYGPLGNVTIDSSKLYVVTLSGIDPSAGSRTIIRNSEFSQLIIAASSGVSITGNNLTGTFTYSGAPTSSQALIKISGSSDIVISGNALVTNAYVISIVDGLVTSSNILVYNNSFYTIYPVMAYLATPSTTIEFNTTGWGNYWSQYSGLDANNDGIIDTPYLIFNNTSVSPPVEFFDYYPLAVPPVPLPNAVFLAQASANTAFTITTTGNQTVVAQLRLWNLGNGTMTLAGINLTSSVPGVFTLGGPTTPVIVYPGAYVPITIVFSPPTSGVYDGKLSLSLYGPFSTTVVDNKTVAVETSLTLLINVVGVSYLPGDTLQRIHITIETWNEASPILSALTGQENVNAMNLKKVAANTTINELVSGLPVTPELKSFDANNDGLVTALDLVTLLNEKGLAKMPPKVSKEFAKTLISQLETLYGQGLVRLPTLEGKLYLAALMELAE